MSILNRDYMRSSSRHPLMPSGWGVVEIIIALNIAIFVLLNLMGLRLQPVLDQFENPVTDELGRQLLERGAGMVLSQDWLSLSTTSLAQFKIHTLVTYGFVHHGPFHILLNMVMFWQFGRMMEREWGSKLTVAFYLLSCAFAGGGNLVLGLLEYGVFGYPYDIPLIGASGAVAAFVIAFALTNSDARLSLFGVIPLSAMTLAYIFVGFDVISLIGYWISGPTAPVQTAHGAHLFGALYGYLYVLQRRGQLPFSVLAVPKLGRRTRRRRRSSRSSETAFDYAEPAPRVPTKDEKRMDELLTKVKDGGLDALSPEEREFMMDMSKRYRRN